MQKSLRIGTDWALVKQTHFRPRGKNELEGEISGAEMVQGK